VRLTGEGADVSEDVERVLVELGEQGTDEDEKNGRLVAGATKRASDKEVEACEVFDVAVKITFILEYGAVGGTVPDMNDCLRIKLNPRCHGRELGCRLNIGCVADIGAEVEGKRRSS
jgi:hypothetical protein